MEQPHSAHQPPLATTMLFTVSCKATAAYSDHQQYLLMPQRIPGEPFACQPRTHPVRTNQSARQPRAFEATNWLLPFPSAPTSDMLAASRALTGASLRTRTIGMNATTTGSV